MKISLKLKSAALVLSCYIMWGVLPVFWKLYGDFNSLYILALRIIFSSLVSFMAVILLGKINEIKEVMRDKKQLVSLSLAGIFIGINWGSYIYAVNSSHILDASLAYFLNPLIAFALGIIFFKEKLSKIKILSVVIAAIGIVVPFVMYKTVPVFAFVIGGSFAVYSAIKKNVKVSAVTSIFIETAVLLPLAIAMSIAFELNGINIKSSLSETELILPLVSGIVTSLPLLLFSKGIKNISMSLCGVLMYINPTLQMLIGIFAYNEKLDTAKIIMFACVWSALVIFLIAENKKAPERK